VIVAPQNRLSSRGRALPVIAGVLLGLAVVSAGSLPHRPSSRPRFSNSPVSARATSPPVSTNPAFVPAFRLGSAAQPFGWSTAVGDFNTDGTIDGTDFGEFSNQLWGNSSDGLRKYDGLQFQGAYRLTKRWNFTGAYTLQINNDGNQEGEGNGTPGAPSAFPGYYPELFNESRNYPIGRLFAYEKHRARAWTTYDLGMGKAGDLDIGLLYRLDSGQAYSISSPGRPLTSVQQQIGNALYATLPTTQTIYFGQRGAGTSPDSRFDLALTYTLPVYRRRSSGQGRDAQHVQLHSAHQLQLTVTPTPTGRRMPWHPDQLHQGANFEGDLDLELPLPATSFPWACASGPQPSRPRRGGLAARRLSAPDA
jgi:hypothetical protein